MHSTNLVKRRRNSVQDQKQGYNPQMTEEAPDMPTVTNVHGENLRDATKDTSGAVEERDRRKAEACLMAGV
ncbi:hypothetical protein NDU88_003681 [Pleurodeles waltl]|uniref:Uncharacterized protein n=1 Tax=Pleurodeles waltl TaxID=8319 RepID=A0AAV7SGL4_PLEWA|nr:hypothetical protein NDU88_003681 [Pleurodeles waltl]